MREIDPEGMVRALREAQFLRRFDLAAMQEVLNRRPNRALRALVDDLVLTQSRLEDRLLEICDRHGLERPLTQQQILGHRVDFVWPCERVIVETDGWRAHGTRSAFQADRAAANRLQIAGFRVLRFTAADIKRPHRVARQIRSALADRRT
jgi:very-short-patch-repair endonuclease